MIPFYMSSKFSIAEKTKVFINLFLSKKKIHLILFGFSALQVLQVLSRSLYFDNLLILNVTLIFSCVLSIYTLYWWKIYFKILTSNNKIVRYILNTLICVQIAGCALVFISLLLLQVMDKFGLFSPSGIWLMINTGVLNSFFLYCKDIFVFWLISLFPTRHKKLYIILILFTVVFHFVLGAVSYKYFAALIN